MWQPFNMFFMFFLILFCCGCSSEYAVLGLQLEGCVETFEATYKARVADSDIPGNVDEGEVVDCSWLVEFMSLVEGGYEAEPCLWIQAWDIEGEEWLNTGAWVKPDEFYQIPLSFSHRGEEQSEVIEFDFHGANQREVGLILYADGVELDRQRVSVE